MGNTPTPHIGATKEQVAKTVLMAGDPLRAKYIAETFLDKYECVNTVRNMFGFTGEYKGKPVSVFGHGMGMPSIGIYSYELFNFYDVENIIRIGSAGTISDKVNLRDVVIAVGASTDSAYAHQYNLPGTFSAVADFGLARAAVEAGEKMSIPTVTGNVLSSDVFYDDDDEAFDKWRKMGILAVEMEAAALYMNAARAGKKALCMLTISDDIYGGKKLSVEDRQTGFTDMMKIALEVASGLD